MSDTVQQIKDRLNIFDVISPYVELHKAGKNFKGKSPFSAEKTPSFYVSPDRGMYYCFSTSQGGDMFTFIQVIEGVDFKEALKLLADKAGVELVPENPQKRSERERLYGALSEAKEFYVTQLHNHPEAQAYLEQRGVKAETIRTWQIGYAPGPPQSGWREIKDHLESLGYNKDELLKTGLIKMAEGGKEPFDVFRDRIMFPMNDSSGKVVAFSGRLLGKNDKAPKYVNSPETELYKKSELLFGYDKAKQGIRQLDFSLIVEGQFDVVMAHQAGYCNTVAVSGTALTAHHIQLLERLSDRVVLALDADRAGVAAVKRAADIMLRRGLDVKVAEVPDGQDPADLVRENKTKLKEVVGQAVHVIEFLLHQLQYTESDTRALKLKVREEVLPYIILLPNRIDQEHFVGIIAKAIGTSTEAIRFELDRLRESSKGEVFVTDHALDIRIETQGGDLVQKTYTFLCAASDLLEKDQKAWCTVELEKLSQLTVLEPPETTAVAETTFILERQFEKMSTHGIFEQVITALNQLRIAIAKREIGNLREQMRDMSSDEQLHALEQIARWEKVLRTEPLHYPTLTDKKD